MQPPDDPTGAPGFPPPPGQQSGFPPAPQAGYQFPGYQQPYQQPGYQPPPGYLPYGGMPVGQKSSGMAIAAMVLSLVGLIPCFWFFQVPGLLGMIFGFVGLGATKDGTARGRGMAITGVVLGILLLVVCVVVWIAIANDPNSCFHFGTGTNTCG
jgi:hypothetical protein